MRVGAYETGDALGQGGAGSVFRARAADGRIVAVKLLRVLGADAAKRFEREARLAASLGEENGFVPILDSGVEKGVPFIVMPLLAGGTLRQRLARGPLGVPETRALGETLARALGAAHGRGVVHRDVKPENVLFPGSGATGRPLLADLGLGKHFDLSAPGASRSEALSRSGLLLGSAGYMPPEQMSDASTVGPPADVFALGCVLYECLAGESPFRGDTALEIVTRVDAGAYTPLATLRGDVPRDLARAIERALARDPGARFPDGTAFARALRGGARRVALASALLLAVVGAASLGGAALLARRARTPVRGSAPGDATGAAPVPRPGPPGAAPRDPSERARELILRARAANRQLETHEEGALLDEALALEPRSAEAHALRALLAVLEGDKARALAEAAAAFALDARCAVALVARSVATGDPADLERALAIDPDLAVAYEARSAVRVRAGDAAGGVANATRAIELDPGAASPWLLRARARAALGDAAWRDDLAASVERAPRSARLAVAAANLFTDMQDLPAALAACDRAVALDPREATTWSGRAYTRLLGGDHAGAEEDASRAIGLDAHLGWAWQIRATARGERRDAERAAADATRALAWPHPGVPAGVWETTLLMTRAMKGGRGPRAIRADLERVLAIGAQDMPDARAWLAAHPAAEDPPEEDARSTDELLVAARSALDRHDEATAEALASHAIERSPDEARAWLLRAEVRLVHARVSEALDDVNEALELGAEPALGLYLRSSGRTAIRDFPGAAADGEEAVVRAPGEAAAWAARANARHLTGDDDGAIADCAVAFLHPPAPAGVYFTLGGTLLTRGDLPAVRAVLEIAIAVAPGTRNARGAQEWLDAHPR